MYIDVYVLHQFLYVYLSISLSIYLSIYIYIERETGSERERCAPRVRMTEVSGTFLARSVK